MSEDLSYLMPHMFGQPFYPGGLPCRIDQFSIDGATIKDIFLRHYEKPTGEDEDILKAYVFYYINAPLFNMVESEDLDKVKEINPPEISLDDLIFKCLDCGLDPF